MAEMWTSAEYKGKKHIFYFYFTVKFTFAEVLKWQRSWGRNAFLFLWRRKEFDPSPESQFLLSNMHLGLNFSRDDDWQEAKGCKVNKTSWQPARSWVKAQMAFVRFEWKFQSVNLLDSNDFAHVFWILLGYSYCALNNKKSKTLLF